MINGAATRVPTTDTLTLTIDTSGYVSFIYAASSLATPSLLLSLHNGSFSTIDPTGAVIKKPVAITKSDHLTSTTCVDARCKT